VLRRPDPSPSELRRRRYRARRAAGRACTTVEYDGDVLAFLIKARWLQECEADDRALVGKAIAAMVADTARRVLLK